MSQALVTASFPLPSLVGSLDAYISAVHRIPVLSVEEEQALSREYLADGDLAAAKKLVLSHLRFVVHVARGYSGYGLPHADLIQEGNIGLMKAVKRFDPDAGRAPGVASRCTGSAPRCTSTSCATGAWSRSPRPRRSASCSSTCASPRSAWAG